MINTYVHKFNHFYKKTACFLLEKPPINLIPQSHSKSYLSPIFISIPKWLFINLNPQIENDSIDPPSPPYHPHPHLCAHPLTPWPDILQS